MLFHHFHTFHDASRTPSAGYRHPAAYRNPSLSVWRDGRTGSRSCTAGLSRTDSGCISDRGSYPYALSAPAFLSTVWNCGTGQYRLSFSVLLVVVHSHIGYHVCGRSQ